MQVTLEGEFNQTGNTGPPLQKTPKQALTANTHKSYDQTNHQEEGSANETEKFGRALFQE